MLLYLALFHFDVDVAIAILIFHLLIFCLSLEGIFLEGLVAHDKFGKLALVMNNWLLI